MLKPAGGKALPVAPAARTVGTFRSIDAIPTAGSAPVFPEESIDALAASHLFLQRLKARPAFLKFRPPPLDLTAQIQQFDRTISLPDALTDQRRSVLGGYLSFFS
jgi:hypothetical protein